METAVCVTIGFACTHLWRCCSRRDADEPRCGTALAGRTVGAAREGTSFVLRTDDTRLAVGVSSDQKLCIYELSGPDGWNWTTVPSVFPLLDRVDVDGVQISPAWTYSQGRRWTRATASH